jgi:hypothetical protein
MCLEKEADPLFRNCHLVASVSETSSNIEFNDFRALPHGDAQSESESQ